MKFKLSNDELRALTAFISEELKKMKKKFNETSSTMTMPTRIGGLMFISQFDIIHLMLLKKVLEPKDKYTIKFSVPELVSFWNYFNQRTERTTHLGNMIQIMCESIYQQIISKQTIQ